MLFELEPQQAAGYPLGVTTYTPSAVNNLIVIESSVDALLLYGSVFFTTSVMMGILISLSCAAKKHGIGAN